MAHGSMVIHGAQWIAVRVHTDIRSSNAAKQESESKLID